MKKQIPRIIGAAAIAAVVIVYATTFVVREGEGAVVETLGKVTAVLAAPGDAGLHLVAPWPIQKVRRFDLRERALAGDLVEVSTSDGQPLVARPFMSWRIVDPAAFRTTVGTDEERSGELAAGYLRNAVSDAFARRRFAEIVAPGPGGALPTIEADALRAVAERVRPDGIEVIAVGFHELVLPPAATEGVFAQMRQAKTQEAERLESTAKAQADLVRAQADGEYERRLAEARAAAGEIIARAHAKQAELLGTADPTLVIFLDKLAALKDLLSGTATIVWDSAMPPFDIIGRLREKQGAPEGARE